MTAIVMVMMSDEEVASFGRSIEAGFGALRTARGLLPLVAMEVDARVVGIVAATEVAQTFVNTTGTPIEATYIFPLPDRAAVTRFRMEVGGRVIEGAIDERGKAREDYDQAIAQGKHASIAEEERPGVFTLRVGNLMPGEAATVRISLVGPLPIDDGEVTFQFPLVVAERYMPGAGLVGDPAGLGTASDTSLVPDASRISPPRLLPGMANPVRLGLRVAIEDPDITGVASSLHTITAAKQDAFVIEIGPGERLDRDFILRWRIDPRQHMRSQLACADDADGRGGTFMVTLVPPSTTSVAAKPRDVVFLIDRSGSMAGWKMVAARRAAARMIDTLTSRDRFCALAFDNRLEALPFDQLVEATDRNRFHAVEMLSKIDSRGGTEMEEPLRRAVQLLAGYDDRERVVVLVTDGQVGNEHHILAELGARLKNVRVFALGIDQSVNAAFLRRLAGAGGGLCELVESEDRLDAVMARIHRRIGMPVATDLHLRAIGFDVDETSLAPKKLPDIYAGAPVSIFGRYRGTAPATAAIELDATSYGEPMRVRIERHGDLRPSTFLAAGWARARIRDLEDQYASSSDSWAKQQVEKEIVQISKHFRVLSRFTAFLAIDGDRVVNPGGHQHQVVQAVEGQARGMAAHQVPSSNHGAFRGRPGGYMPPRPTESAPAPMPVMARSQGFASADFSMEPPAPLAPARPAPLAPASGPRPSPPPAPMAARPTYAPPSYDEDRDGGDGPSDIRSAPSSPAASVLPPSNRATARAPSPSAYLVQLGAIGRDLAARGSEVAAVRILRQRLTHWIEDLRAMGGEDALVAAVEALLQPLYTALATAANLDAVVATLVAELAKLASGQPPPPPRPTSRGAFWK